MAVKILLTLEGADTVKDQLADVKKAGQDLVDSLKGAGDPEAIKGFIDSLNKVKPSTDAAIESTQAFSEAVHVLHPILKAAGIEVQNFAGFARLASAGVAGLAAAISGTLVVAFANAEEAAASTQAKLGGIFGSSALGSKAFDQIKQAAKDLDTTASALAPAFEAATTAIQRFIQVGTTAKFVSLRGVDLPQGVAGNINDTAAAVENLIKIIRASGATQEEAEKAATAFFKALQQGGKLTAEALQGLDTGTIQLLAEALGKGTESAEKFRAETALAPANILRITQALAQFGPQAQRAFDATAVKSFKDEFQGLVNDLADLFKITSGTTFSQFLVKALSDVRKGLSDSIDQINKFSAAVKQMDAAVNNVPGLKLLGDALNFLNQKVQQAGQAIGGQAISTGAKKASDDAALAAANFKSVGDALGASFKQAPEAAAGVKALGDSFKIVPQSAKEASDQIAPAMKPGLDAAQKQIDAAFSGPPTAPGASVFGPQGFLPSTAEVKSTLSGLGQTIQDALQQAGALAGQDFAGGFGDTAQQRINEAFTQIEQTAQQRIASAFAALGQQAPDFSQIAVAFQSATSSIPGTAQSVWDQVKAIFSQPITMNVQTGTTGFAGGGPVVGPGTATSDSILARLSAGEFVHPTRAVSYYGLQFMEAIRQLRFPRELLFDPMMPRFASGGVASSTSASPTPVHLHLDGAAFQLNASENVANALRKHAVRSRLASAGRKPSWY